MIYSYYVVTKNMNIVTYAVKRKLQVIIYDNILFIVKITPTGLFSVFFVFGLC